MGIENVVKQLLKKIPDLYDGEIKELIERLEEEKVAREKQKNSMVNTMKDIFKLLDERRVAVFHYYRTPKRGFIGDENCITNEFYVELHKMLKTDEEVAIEHKGSIYVIKRKYDGPFSVAVTFFVRKIQKV